MTSLKVKNNKLTLEYLNSTLQDKNLTIIEQVLLENSINYTAFGRSIGTNKIISDFETWLNIFSDIKFKVSDTILNGDTVVYRLIEQAKHVGHFKSIPPTGKVITFDATISFRANGNKIAGYVLSTNLEAILHQIMDSSKHDINELMRKPIIAGGDYAFFEKVQSYLVSKNICLTIQQIKCLSLWFNRKTAKEIGALLRISPRTVEVYFDGIKTRLRIHSKSKVFDFIEDNNLKYMLNECASILIGEP